MALPSSGTITLAQIQTEFGGSNPVGLSEYYRGGLYVTANNTNVPTSGAISLSNFYGAVKQFSFTISSNKTNASLRTLAIDAGWNQADRLVATIAANVVLSANSTAASALTVSGSYPSGVELVNNGYIIGMGGAGGNYGAAGNAGGTALSVASSITITNNWVIGGGGGGGGSSPVFGWCGQDLTTPGGGGASGLYPAPGGTGGNYSGNPSTLSGSLYSVPGSGVQAGACSVSNSPSGAGGNLGTAGVTSGYAGGAPGNSVVGNSYITWTATGTRNGPIS